MFSKDVYANTLLNVINIQSKFSFRFYSLNNNLFLLNWEPCLHLLCLPSFWKLQAHYYFFSFLIKPGPGYKCLQFKMGLLGGLIFKVFISSTIVDNAIADKSLADSAPNIIMFVADDLGYNDVGWNNEKVRTPYLDELAKEGIILDQHYA